MSTKTKQVDPCEFTTQQVENFKCFLNHAVTRDLGVESARFAFHMSYENKNDCHTLHLIAEPEPSIFPIETTQKREHSGIWYAMLMDAYTIQQFMKMSLMGQSIHKYLKDYESLILNATTIKKSKMIEFKKYFQETIYYQTSTKAEKKKLDQEFEQYTETLGLFFRPKKVDIPYKMLVEWFDTQVKMPIFKWSIKSIFAFSGIENFEHFIEFFDVNKDAFLEILVLDERFLQHTQYFNNLRGQGIDFLGVEDAYKPDLQKLRRANFQPEIPEIVVLKRKII